MQRSSLLVGDGLECRSIHLAASMILRKVLLKKIHFGRVLVWCGVNWMIIHFSRASIPPSNRFYIYPFFQIILVQNSYSAAKNWIISVPQAAAKTFAFSTGQTLNNYLSKFLEGSMASAAIFLFSIGEN